MNSKNTEIAENKNRYDLIILGQGLQASLLLLNAVDKGLSSVLISENDCAENLNEEPFQLIEPFFKPQIYKTSFQNNLFKSLKKSFPYLLISSKTDNYKSLNFFERFIQTLIKSVTHRKIEKKSKSNHGSLSYNSSDSYKFSSARMTIELQKKAIRLGAKIYSYSQIINLKTIDNLKYNIQINSKLNNQITNLESKSVLRFNLNNSIFKTDGIKIANKPSETLYFTYPSSKLNLEKNKILHTKHQELKIIKWFDFVYFEFSDANTPESSLDDLIIFINNKFIDIQIDKSEIIDFGTFNKLLFAENKNKIQLVYFDSKRQIQFHYKTIIQWFAYSNNICNLIIKHTKKGKQGKSAIGRIEFGGSDLPESINPLRIMELADEKYDQAKQILKSPLYFKKLFYRYGSEIDLITNKAYENWNITKNSLQAWLSAEIWYAIEHEFCKKPKDFIQNRTEEWLVNSQNNLEEIDRIFNELSN